MKYYLAIDLGASSGRHVVGYKKNGEIVLEEIHRFKTGMSQSKDGLVWNIPTFFKEIKIGIKKAFKKYKKIESLSIDTWGVDYVLMNGKKEIKPFYAYRNERNAKAAKKLHKIIPFEELYSHTGIQFAAFNTIYQLFDDLKSKRLEKATDYLMLPCYFSYKLTGKKSHEYTNETTGALLNAKTGKYDLPMLSKLGFSNELFNKIEKPGTVLGNLLPEIAKEVGGQTKVILCASHDTGSAFEAIDVPDDGIILSSGTWSLFGIKSKLPICNKKSLKANFTNEGGVGYIRFLKNIMGMWIVTQVCEQEGLSFLDIQTKLDNNNFDEIFDVNDPSLVAPKNMKTAILKLLKRKPKDEFDLFNSIYHSMAESYNKACEELEKITGKRYHYIYIVGGGAKNKYLNKLVEKHTGKKVVAFPIEATCLGNIKVQMKVED